MSKSAGDRTEKATPKRRVQARERGQVARSREWPIGFSYLALFAGLTFFGAWAGTRLADTMTTVLSQAGGTGRIEPGDGWAILTDAGWTTVRVTAPFAVLGFIALFLANALQVKPGFTPKVLKPRFGVLNPVSGVKRLFSLRSFVQLARDLLKLAIIGTICFGVIWRAVPDLLRLTGSSPGATIDAAARLIMGIGWSLVAIYVVIMVLDLVFERWQHERDMRMTKDEVKRESRDADVSPELRGQVKRRQREMANQRMMAAVPDADVVITNPTHYAVALRYVRSKPAPEVVAKGADHVAHRIIATARENGVTIVQDPPLARSLHAAAEVGQFIPPEAFGAVAEILAHVYRVGSREPAAV
jgi:flagellar biosynthetic protein FlhB